MKKEVVDYIAMCLQCQKVKTKNKHVVGILQPFPIPEWKWEVVIVDFIAKFPKTMKQHYSIMVMVDKLNKTAHFNLVKTTHKAINIA